MDGFIQTKEASKILNVSQTTFWKMVKKGLIKKYKVVGKAYYKTDELEAFLTSEIEK